MNATPATPKAIGLVDALREAVVTMLAALATLACTLAIASGSGPAVLAVVLCLSLSRSQLDDSWPDRFASALVLPVLGLAAVGIAWLLQRAPWLGAAVFVAGMFISIWLRRFGATAHRFGSLIALPFVALLVTPPISANEAGALPTWLVPIIIALFALFWVSVSHALARRSGFLPAFGPLPQQSAPQVRNDKLKPSTSTRMAIQMAAALGMSFAMGYLFFSERWTWIVLTTFIVISGNRGRLDVVYKSVLRVAGAAAGTLLALGIAAHGAAHDYRTAALILATIFLGVWLRPLSYAWWALFVTIALALLQGFADAPVSQLLLQRLEEIFIGALIGVAVAWWVVPVRSSGVLRRRLADALSALSAGIDPSSPQRTPESFAAAVAGVEQLAPSFRASRMVTRRFRRLQPADWIDALIACRQPAVALIESGATPPDVRRAVGAARKALLEPSLLLTALHDLQRALAA
jgi:hypothetical protein